MLRMLFLCLFGLSMSVVSTAQAQFVDEKVQQKGGETAVKLKAWLTTILPQGSDPWVSAEDGRVFDVYFQLPASTNLFEIAKEKGVETTDVVKAFEEWAIRVNADFVDKTTKLVADSGNDPDFNPQTDCVFTVSCDSLPQGNAKGTRMMRSFVGTSFQGERDSESPAVLVPPRGEPTGGELRIVITPERQEWAPKETITGRIKITNTGKTRVNLSAWWYAAVGVTDPAGKTPKAFHIMGNIDPAANAAMLKFVLPGEVVDTTFQIFTDRLHSMEHGYYLDEGEWILKYEQMPPNVRVILESVRIRVASKPGSYTGPRILSAIGALTNIVLIREDGSVDVLDASTGQRRGHKDAHADTGRGGWSGLHPTLSPDGRLLATCETRESPIAITALFGEPPPVAAICAPAKLVVGPGNFSARGFSRDGKELYCVTNNALAVMSLKDGSMVRTSALPDMWPVLSPDARHGAAMDGLTMRIVGYRGDDRFTVRLEDLTKDPVPSRTVEIKGHGTSPDMAAGIAGVYLADEFESSVVYVLFSGEVAGPPSREFKTGGPASFVGESPDGTMVAFAWPRFEFESRNGPTTVGLYRVSDGVQLCTIVSEEPRAVLLLSDPPRIATLPRHIVGDGFGGGSSIEELATIFDARTGARLKELDLTPPREAIVPKDK